MNKIYLSSVTVLALMHIHIDKTGRHRLYYQSLLVYTIDNTHAKMQILEYLNKSDNKSYNKTDKTYAKKA